ncbi:conserved hypothetical protein [Anaeromyxobacter dehalogenans 2CP-1]|uniref:DUF3943 domain-containing protein n=1 Tax=Anaeromyxobacter dehalogenans (strain ATCC BAA-258 / DSM 21875 / 2CP-1) TaxID=455488 RepID=B8J679_ANAD2|nr:DUF3943 domain-containing protein [Anaeromyxobacter dehalogenans]ACL66974.1 conserved hypothetical protein [Anaeromyxobacter dehalogenans 2CP-1]
MQNRRPHAALAAIAAIACLAAPHATPAAEASAATPLAVQGRTGLKPPAPASRSARGVAAAGVAPAREGLAAGLPDLRIPPREDGPGVGTLPEDSWHDPLPRRGSASRWTVPAVESLSVNLAMMGWNRWVGAAPWADISGDSIGRNLRSRWVLDDDQFWVNQFGHPYQGTWAFSAARSAGQGFWVSSAYAFAASGLWEIAGETERPSRNDQVTTTVAGMVLGEILGRFSDALRAEGGTWNGVAASVLSPMGAVNRRLLGPTRPERATSSRWALAMGGATGDATGDRGTWGGGVGLDFAWGLPGDPDLELEQPFDHFVLEARYGFARDPDATVRARGLLAGRSFEAAPARGLYGLFLLFDFDTPQRFHVSTSALGAGASARADLGGGLALEGDLVGAAVILGAAGTVDRGDDGKGRDYRIGPGAQALAGLDLVAGTRARLGAVARQYLIFGEGEVAGDERIAELGARGSVRVLGAHAVAVDVSRHLRHASADASGPVREAGWAFQVSWVIQGGVAPRAADWAVEL